MKYLLLLAMAAVAMSSPYNEYLERRGNVKKAQKAFLHKGAINIQMETPEPRFTKKQPPPDSPRKKDDNHTEAFAKIAGPGHVTTGRSKIHPLQNSQLIVQGTIAEKETHDAVWSMASAMTVGNPTPQSHRMHPTKAEGKGQSGSISVTAPRGGYGTLKKEVDGQIVVDQRVRGGQIMTESHTGGHPGEVKFSGTASRGGGVDTTVTNNQSQGPARVRVDHTQ